MAWRDSCRHNPDCKGLGHYPLLFSVCKNYVETARKVRPVGVKYWSRLSLIALLVHLTAFRAIVWFIFWTFNYGQDKARNKYLVKNTVLKKKMLRENSSQMLLVQNIYVTLSGILWPWTCTLLPLGGLTLLGLSAALCLGDVKTASFEIFYNSKEIKHFLSFANQSLSHLRRKLPWHSKSWSLTKGSFKTVAGDQLIYK